jgi:hypothetical protein
MLRAYVLVAEPLGLFSAIGKHPLAFMTQRQID